MDTNSLENLNYQELSQVEALKSVATKFMTKVYGWMSFALIITALAAHAVARSEYALSLIFGNSLGEHKEASRRHGGSGGENPLSGAEIRPLV